MITKEQVQDWLGDDDILEILASIANGEYTPDQLKSDIEQYEGGTS